MFSRLELSENHLILASHSLWAIIHCNRYPVKYFESATIYCNCGFPAPRALVWKILRMKYLRQSSRHNTYVCMYNIHTYVYVVLLMFHGIVDGFIILYIVIFVEQRQWFQQRGRLSKIDRIAFMHPYVRLTNSPRDVKSHRLRCI